MNTKDLPADVRERFLLLLHRALTHGLPVTGLTGLGPRTQAAIVEVARDHPDATPRAIARAYEAFHDEHD